jgi:hypothetical protein
MENDGQNLIWKTGSRLTRRIRLPISPKIAEPTPSAVESPDPIIKHEDGMFSVWYDADRFPSHEFARAVWLRRNTFRGLQ